MRRMYNIWHGEADAPPTLPTAEGQRAGACSATCAANDCATTPAKTRRALLLSCSTACRVADSSLIHIHSHTPSHRRPCTRPPTFWRTRAHMNISPPPQPAPTSSQLSSFARTHAVHSLCTARLPAHQPFQISGFWLLAPGAARQNDAARRMRSKARNGKPMRKC